MSNSDPPPTRASLRKVLNAVLVSDSDFDAFCLDRFPSVHQRFSSDMDRTRKTNLLIEHQDAQVILSALRDQQPDEVARHEKVLQSESPPGPSGPDTEVLAALRNELATLLALAFTQPDLHQFIGSGPGGADVLGLLPEAQGKKQFVERLVEQLMARGQITPEFFARLLQERSHRAGDIGQVQAHWAQAMHGEPAVSPPPPPSWGTMSARAAVGAALRLDRSEQWAKVLATCQKDRHALFLLYGQSRQSLGLFLDRIHHFLTEESGRPHGVYRVPFRREHSFASSGAEWETHVSYALAPGQRGTAAEHLAGAARQQALVLILGLRPLHHLTPEQEEGLHELICWNLPRMIEVARPAHPVRALIAVDFDDRARSLEPTIDAWGLEVEKRKILDYCSLSEVKFPSWDEVESYLRNLRPRPSPEVIATIKGEFESIVSDEHATFQHLTERLDRHLLMDV